MIFIKADLVNVDARITTSLIPFVILSLSLSLSSRHEEELAFAFHESVAFKHDIQF